MRHVTSRHHASLRCQRPYRRCSCERPEHVDGRPATPASCPVLGAGSGHGHAGPAARPSVMCGPPVSCAIGADSRARQRSGVLNRFGSFWAFWSLRAAAVRAVRASRGSWRKAGAGILVPAWSAIARADCATSTQWKTAGRAGCCRSDESPASLPRSARRPLDRRRRAAVTGPARLVEACRESDGRAFRRQGVLHRALLVTRTPPPGITGLSRHRRPGTPSPRVSPRIGAGSRPSGGWRGKGGSSPCSQASLRVAPVPCAPTPRTSARAPIRARLSRQSPIARPGRIAPEGDRRRHGARRLSGL